MNVDFSEFFTPIRNPRYTPTTAVDTACQFSPNYRGLPFFKWKPNSLPKILRMMKSEDLQTSATGYILKAMYDKTGYREEQWSASQKIYRPQSLPSGIRNLEELLDEANEYRSIFQLSPEGKICINSLLEEQEGEHNIRVLWGTHKHGWGRYKKDNSVATPHIDIYRKKDPVTRRFSYYRVLWALHYVSLPRRVMLRKDFVIVEGELPGIQDLHGPYGTEGDAMKKLGNVGELHGVAPGGELHGVA